MLVNLKTILADTRRRHYAVGLFNCVTLEMTKGILAAAEIRHIYTNGQTAHKLYGKHQAQGIALPEGALPSTSPANAAWSLERLTAAWSVIRDA